MKWETTSTRFPSLSRTTNWCFGPGKFAYTLHELTAIWQMHFYGMSTCRPSMRTAERISLSVCGVGRPYFSISMQGEYEHDKFIFIKAHDNTYSHILIEYIIQIW